MEGTLAEIRCFAGTFAPRGWAFCNGQSLQISQNQALFSLLGTTYGGNGMTTFNLPNLNGRVPVGAGQGYGFSPRTLGQTGGQQAVTLTTDQLPMHTHTGSGAFAPGCSTAGGESAIPQGNVPALSGSNLYSNFADATMMMQPANVQVNTAGGNGAHDNMPPYLGLNYIICLEGYYPSRN